MPTLCVCEEAPCVCVCVCVCVCMCVCMCVCVCVCVYVYVLLENYQKQHSARDKLIRCTTVVPMQNQWLPVKSHWS